MDNYMEVKFDAVSRNEAFARTVIASFCVELNPTVDELDDIKTVISEAVTNCIVHAYAGNGGEVILRAKIKDDVLHMEIEDYGKGIENIEQAMQPFFSGSDSEERSGMGFTIMQTFTDDLTVERNSSGGTKVIMSKNFRM